MKCILALWLAGSLPAAAATSGTLIVVPNSAANVEGNSASTGPLSTGTNTMRYQQVFDSSQFTSSGSEPWLITGVSFRLDTNGQTSFTTLTNIQVNLSTTLREPDSLSPVFALNVGLDDQIVFGPASTPLNAGYSPFMSPQAFDAHIGFSQAFVYDPSQGNLLFDVRNFGGGPGPLFDAVNAVGDPTSSLFALPVGSTSGTLETRGLVVQFLATPVPEPRAVAFLAVAAFAFFLFARNRVRRH